MKKKGLFFALLSAILLFSSQQLLFSNNNPVLPFNGKIKGQVKDAQQNRSIEYANIALYKKLDSSLVSGTISDNQGNFQMDHLGQGEYYLSVDFIGFKQIVINDLVLDKKTKNLDLGEIQLKQASYELDQVTVSADKNYVDFKIDKKVVNVSRHANAAGGTVAEVLENVPSIQVDIEGNVTLRGSSSYTVLIDGKPSPVSGNDILRQIPANNVENVEIITNPSAKYDPEGTTGIINIILKKGYSEGLNGMLNANYGTWNKIGADINLNYRKKKLNFFLVTDYGRRPGNGVSENNREIYAGENTFFIDEKTDRKRTMRPFKVNPGIDIYFNEKNNLSLSTTYGGWGMDRAFSTRYTAYYQEDLEKTFSLSENNFTIDGYYYAANANYQHIFNTKDHKIDFNLSAWQWNSDQIEKSYEQNADNYHNPVSILSNNRSEVNEIRNNLHFKTDYSLPLKSGKFEMGLDLRLINQEGEVLYEKQDISSQNWLVYNDFSYQSEFYRNIYAFYSTYASTLLGLDYQLGLRAEKTERNVYQFKIDQDYPVDLFKLYPSVHISKNFNPKQQFQISYSRRINRPQPWQLSPYPGYTDSYNYFQGNPLLKPADTDALELNYIHRFKLFTLSTGAYFRHTINGQEMVQSINEENPEIVYLSFGNIDRSISYGLEYMINYVLNNKLNLNLSGNIYQLSINSSYTGEDVNRQSFNWDARINSSYNFDPNTSMQFSGVYNGPTVNGQGTTKAFYYFDLGMRKRFLDRKLSVSLLVHNVFRTGKYEVIAENDDYMSGFYYKGESPVIRMNVSYVINNYQRKRRDNLDLGAGAN